MVGEDGVDRGAADRAQTGAAWAASFSLTTTPKRAAICEINRAMTGADWAATPSLATKRALSLTDLASAARTVKYPLSKAVSPPGPPRANTSTQARAASGTVRSSPSSRAISAIERRRIVVEIGSSTGSAASPSAPPTAPDAAAASLWARFAGLAGAFRSSVRKAS